MSHLLSKSSYITGKQCEKRLWFRKHRRDLIPPIPAAQQHIFDQGTDVGILAQQRYPGGVDVSPESYYDFAPSIQRTKELIDAGCEAIYEAAFLYDEILVAVDILVRRPSGWQAVEVKSSTSVSEVNYNDAALQYYVMTHCGLTITDISILHINTAYVRQGDVDPHLLFSEVSVLEEVLQRQGDLQDEIQHLKATVTQNTEPPRNIGQQCSNPYSCEFMHHCWSHIPDYSVFNISRLSGEKKWELYHADIIEVTDVPQDFPLSERQRFEVQSAREGTQILDKPRISHFISQLQYPLYFLDFETLAPAIPVFEASSPYRQHVFQYSVHRIDYPGAEPVHKEYLADPDNRDFRLELIIQMMEDLSNQGTILVYNIAFERTRLQELQVVFPEFADALRALIERMIDLMEPFQKQWFYLPTMRGSYSIKQVLPAVSPQFSYADLPIADGGTASAIFASMVAQNFNGDAATVRQNLLRYCAMDTLAMVEVWRALEAVAQD